MDHYIVDLSVYTISAQQANLFFFYIYIFLLFLLILSDFFCCSVTNERIKQDTQHGATVMTMLSHFIMNIRVQ